MMLFVQFSDNWADEIDVEGGILMTQDEYDKYITAAKRAFTVDIDERGSIDFVIGSNEWIEYQDFRDFERTLKVTKVTKEEAKILKKFHLDDYGHFPEYCFDEYYDKE